VARTRLFYWNKPWPGHVGLVIDIDSGDATPGNLVILAGYYNVRPEILAPIPIGLTGLRNYVSWTAGDQTGNALSGFRAYARTYEEDMIACGGAAPKAAEIVGLNTDAAFDAWHAIRSKQGATWKLLGKNCACVVLRVLRAAGCDQHVHSYMKRNPAIITPQAVWEYGKSAANATGGQIRHQPRQ